MVSSIEFCVISTLLSHCPLTCCCHQNRLKDRSVIQLYSKQTMVYLALADGGGVVGMTDSDDKNSESVGEVVYICCLVMLCHTSIHEQTFSLFPSS